MTAIITTDNMYLLIAGGVLFVNLLFSVLGWRNSLVYANKAEGIGEMLMSCQCDVEGDEEQHARILKMTVDEYRTEKKKGRILFKAGQEIVGIAEGLRAPFRVMR